jgi:hypothetical protein
MLARVVASHCVMSTRLDQMRCFLLRVHMPSARLSPARLITASERSSGPMSTVRDAGSQLAVLS